MNNDIAPHYSGGGDLASAIRDALSTAGKDIGQLTTRDLATVDEFHIRGRPATLELADRMELTSDSQVLDMGSGLGGPARTVAETYGCRVTGIDLTESFCEAATEISDWLDLSDKVRFVHGDATDMPFPSKTFDAAMTIHAAMNIPDKEAFYASARKALKPGRIFAVYDVLQGEGGPVHFPVPWARDPSISFLATPAETRDLLSGAGFEIVEEIELHGGEHDLVSRDGGTNGQFGAAASLFSFVSGRRHAGNGPKPGKECRGETHPHRDLHLSGLTLHLGFAAFVSVSLARISPCKRQSPGQARPQSQRLGERLAAEKAVSYRPAWRCRRHRRLPHFREG